MHCATYPLCSVSSRKYARIETLESGAILYTIVVYGTLTFYRGVGTEEK